jgi:hypothetical protein
VCVYVFVRVECSDELFMMCAQKEISAGEECTASAAGGGGGGTGVWVGARCV